MCTESSIPRARELEQKAPAVPTTRRRRFVEFGAQTRHKPCKNPEPRPCVPTTHSLVFARWSWQYTRIARTILEKLTQITLSISVQKQLFIYKQKVYSFVHIENVPLVKYLIISNVAGIIGHKTVTSKHMISHGEIPWYARWASDILKKEIIKGVDTYDQTCLEVYCAKIGSAFYKLKEIEPRHGDCYHLRHLLLLDPSRAMQVVRSNRGCRWKN